MLSVLLNPSPSDSRQKKLKRPQDKTPYESPLTPPAPYPGEKKFFLLRCTLGDTEKTVLYEISKLRPHASKK